MQGDPYDSLKIWKYYNNVHEEIFFQVKKTYSENYLSKLSKKNCQICYKQLLHCLMDLYIDAYHNIGFQS